MKGDVMLSIRRSIAALFAAAALFAPAASAQARDPGLPMWVIRDADSTIYITGTVHMLPEGVKWDSDKLKAAIKESSELWLELPMGSDPMKFAAESAPILIRYALSAGPPLSSRLTADEMKKLNAAIAKSGAPPQMAMAVNVLKPWYAALLVGISPLIGAGFDSNEGIDVKLAKMAEDDGDAVRGFETIEFQAKMLSSGTDEEQIEALRAALNASDAETIEASASGEAAFRAWANGETEGVASLFTQPDEAEDNLGGASMDAMLKDRNENWAGQIETMLKGAGVHFVAVGAAHIVGPDNLIERLKLRGIEAARYE
jgi:uncharacterized protein YbaP (TraB family)